MIAHDARVPIGQPRRGQGDPGIRIDRLVALKIEREEHGTGRVAFAGDRAAVASTDCRAFREPQRDLAPDRGPAKGVVHRRIDRRPERQSGHGRASVDVTREEFREAPAFGATSTPPASRPLPPSAMTSGSGSV